ncbi:MAG: Maf family protein [Alphaproteobacteria bacterium]
MAQVILASQSKARISMLENAGLSVKAFPAFIDEDAIKQALRAEKASTARAAELLAELKAQKIVRAIGSDPAMAEESVFVIGADQMLVCGDVWFDKPPDMDHAAAQLTALSGKTHQLVSSVVVFKDGERIWHHTDKATLAMRALSPEFIETYLTRCGKGVLGSVGAYHLEGLGAQLFNAVEGDFFTVLGMPLLPLLNILRTHGVMKS